MKQTTDRRIVRTHEALRVSILDLVMDKPISKISITELCKAADINRATFYAYYDSPENLLEKLEAEEVTKFITHLRTWLMSHPNPSAESFFSEALQYVYVEKDSWKVLLCTNNSQRFSHSVAHSFRELDLPLLETKLPGFSLASDYTSEFISVGFIGIIRKALEEDFKELDDALRSCDTRK